MKLDLIRKYGRMIIRHWISWKSPDVSLFGNEIVMVSVNTKVKFYHKMLDILFYLYIYIYIYVQQ